MTLKNKLLAATLMAGLTTLNSASVLAYEDSREIKGNFQTIEMKFAKYGKYSSFNYDQILADYRAEISEKVKVTCNGRDFAIDTANIRLIYKGGCRPFFPCEDVYVYGAELMAFCRE